MKDINKGTKLKAVYLRDPPNYGMGGVNCIRKNLVKVYVRQEKQES